MGQREIYGRLKIKDLLKLFHNPKQKVKFNAHVNEVHSHSQVRN